MIHIVFKEHVIIPCYMENEIDRRSFLKGSAGLLATVAASSPLIETPPHAGERPDIAVVEGEKPSDQTRRAIQELGGMGSFVRRGERVVILPNAEWRYRGTIVNPAVAVEVARLCAQAGAASILVTTLYGIGRWGEDVAQELKAAGARIKSPSHPQDYITVPVPNGKVRKEVTILRDAVENDVLIDIPVFKDHYGARISGCIKNLIRFKMSPISCTFMGQADLSKKRIVRVRF